MPLLQSTDFSSLDMYNLYLGETENDGQLNNVLNLIYGSESVLYVYKNQNNVKQQIDGPILGYTGRFKGGIFLNPNAYPVYLKLYNDSAANVTIGVTETIYKIQIPANGQVVLDSPKVYVSLSTGFTIAVTKFYLDTDNTALASPCEVSIMYETT